MHKSKFLCLPFFLSCWKCLNFICGGDFLVQMFRRKLKVKKYKKLWAFVARIIWQIHFKFCYIFTLTTFFFLWKKIGLVFFLLSSLCLVIRLIRRSRKSINEINTNLMGFEFIQISNKTFDDFPDLIIENLFSERIFGTRKATTGEKSSG